MSSNAVDASSFQERFGLRPAGIPWRREFKGALQIKYQWLFVLVNQRLFRQKPTVIDEPLRAYPQKKAFFISLLQVGSL